MYVYKHVYIEVSVCIAGSIPGLNELTSVSSVAEVSESVLRPLNRYNLSLDRSTMYVPTTHTPPDIACIE